MTFWVLRMGHVVRYQPVLERSQTTITGPRVIGQLDSMKTCNQIRITNITYNCTALYSYVSNVDVVDSTFNLSRKRQKEKEGRWRQNLNKSWIFVVVKTLIFSERSELKWIYFGMKIPIKNAEKKNWIWAKFENCQNWVVQEVAWLIWPTE